MRWPRRFSPASPKRTAKTAPTRLLARELAASFTGYLRALRADGNRIATQPPGRFLMPGELEGSPALTFAPLILEDGDLGPSGSLAPDDGPPLRFL